MRIVLDTTILVRATENSHGPARDLLLNIVAQKQQLILSNEILYEVARVLRYPRLRILYGLSEDRVYDFVGFLREVAKIVPLAPVFTAPIRDVNDVIVIQTAIVGEANFLCTVDDDFYESITVRFLQRAGITVIDDLSLLLTLRNANVT